MTGALSAISATPVRPLAPATNPMAAWLTTLPFASAPASWPMAFMMMSSGVPHTVAWPTAEANAAVLDAADAATQSIKKAFASYHTEGGHASSHGTWPPTETLTLMAHGATERRDDVHRAAHAVTRAAGEISCG